MTGRPRGPLPTPSSILRMRGSWRGRRKGEPQPKAGVPTRPRWLSDPAKALWSKVMSILGPVPGLLTEVDVFALGRYCEAFADWLRCLEQVRRLGEGVVKPEGKSFKVIRFPHASYRLKYEALLDRLEGKFGMSPADRARIRLDTEGTPRAGDDRERFFDAG